MALPTCRKCGGKMFNLHEQKANGYAGHPAYFIVTCAKMQCAEPVGAIPHHLYLADIDYKLDKIMKFLKIK